jgi:hypothetical protein
MGLFFQRLCDFWQGQTSRHRKIASGLSTLEATAARESKTKSDEMFRVVSEQAGSLRLMFEFRV